MNTRSVVLCLLVVIATSIPGALMAGEAPSLAIRRPSEPAPCVDLAARELRRYLYLRTGALVTIQAQPASDRDEFILAVDAALKPESYRLNTIENEGHRQLHLTGGSDIAVLYAAYDFVERLGVRFHLHGDVVPEQRLPRDWRLPMIDVSRAPLFDTRGIQPFHDFTEGPDWWNLDDYKSYLSQAVKLRMNFFGLHCYPEGPVGPEPTVWLGLPGDIESNGDVKFGYPTRYASTGGTAWGYAQVPTSKFAGGASRLFETDNDGPTVTDGNRPWPTDADACNDVFNRTAAMLRSAFTHARQRGIKICVGTETPLTIPALVKKRIEQSGRDPAAEAAIREVYRGTFRRIQRACPIDYYWLWTPEDWTWNSVSDEAVSATMQDLNLALAALKDVDATFSLATCGWVLGPPGDRAAFDKQLPKSVALSCINRQVGFTPVEPGFAAVKDRPTWAIPWLEDDPAMIIPQLWAGRVRRDAADALAYGCTGLLGIHWRTRIISPSIEALARAAWDQRSWNPDLGRSIQPPKVLTNDVHVGGNIADFGSRLVIADRDAGGCVYSTCRWNVDAYRIAVPNGTYRVTLKFCEGHYKEAGKRIFGIKLQNRQVAESIDVFARVGENTPLDLTFDHIRVDAGTLEIAFTREVEFPFIGGIVVEQQDADSSDCTIRRINCGGPSCDGFEADLPPVNSVPAWEHRPRDLPADDFYRDWASPEFGAGVAEPMARLFNTLDGGPLSHGAERLANLPRPSNWDRGPGGIIPNRTLWEQEKSRYAFVDEMAALRPLVQGAGNQARFDYWLNSMRYLRTIGELSCVRGQLDATMERIEGESDATRKELVHKVALPLRIRLARLWEEMMTHLLATVSTPGELGTIANLEQHVRTHNAFLNLHDEKLVEALGESLPKEAAPSTDYRGKPRLIIPTARTDAAVGESMEIKALVLSKDVPDRVVLHWRALGADEFIDVNFDHVARGVFRANLPAMKNDDFEYYVTAGFENASTLIWPATAPQLCQTVIVTPWPAP